MFSPNKLFENKIAEHMNRLKSSKAERSILEKVYGNVDKFLGSPNDFELHRNELMK
jgi:hypothetical protein